MSGAQAEHDAPQVAGHTGDPEARSAANAFFEHLAHELRGPAGVIHGVLDELTRALGHDAVQHETLLAMARRGVHRIARNADRLQHGAQMADGRIRLQRQSCDLAQLLTRAVNEAYALENRQQIELVFVLPSEGIQCEVDSRWMRIALQELAAHMVRDSRTRLEVRLLMDGAGCTVTFSHDGRSERSASRAHDGAGLPLALAHAALSAHGGTLTIGVCTEGGVTGGVTAKAWIPGQV